MHNPSWNGVTLMIVHVAVGDPGLPENLRQVPRLARSGDPLRKRGVSRWDARWNLREAPMQARPEIERDFAFLRR